MSVLSAISRQILIVSPHTVGTVRDPVRNENTESDSQLLQSDERTSDTRRSELGVVHRDQHRESTNTHTSEPSTSVHGGDILGSSSLDGDTEDENDTPSRDRVFSGVNIGNRTGHERTDSGSKFCKLAPIV